MERGVAFFAAGAADAADAHLSREVRDVLSVARGADDGAGHFPQIFGKQEREKEQTVVPGDADCGRLRIRHFARLVHNFPAQSRTPEEQQPDDRLVDPVRQFLDLSEFLFKRHVFFRICRFCSGRTVRTPGGSPCRCRVRGR